MTDLLSVENGIALLTLTAMEIVLGIDNIVFISILCGKLPEHDRARVRTTGIALAVIMRIVLLLGITWIMGLTRPLWTTLGVTLTGQSLILLLGGLFLIAKATYEIHHKIEGGGAAESAAAVPVSAKAIIVQILLLDLVFSLDSVITAVGMVQSIVVMITAVVLAAGAMVVFAGPIGRFVDRHPALKMLALAFLVLIGVMLVAQGLGQKVPKGYIYFAMAFSLGVELLNIRAGTRQATGRTAAT
ncbi:MAG: TerC family protein [Phycisphaerae bacterium]|nr:TerC family protein [Phycisphaerae bacterium]